MATYRINQVDRSGRIIGTPLDIECESDQAAIDQVVPEVHEAEIWQGKRLVRVNRKGPRRD
jgi:hypothetical protein